MKIVRKQQENELKIEDMEVATVFLGQDGAYWMKTCKMQHITQDQSEDYLVVRLDSGTTAYIDGAEIRKIINGAFVEE